MSLKGNKNRYIRTILLYTINLLHNNLFMASKRSGGSILGFFSKSKVQVSSLSTQEIPLVDFSSRLISSHDKISSAPKISTVVETSYLSNLNNLSQGEIFDSSNVSLTTDSPTVVVAAIDEFSCIIAHWINKHLFQNVICHVVILQKFLGVTNNLILSLI